MPLNLERVSPGDLITARSFNALLDTLDALDARLIQVEGRGVDPVIPERIPIVRMGPLGENTIAFPDDPNGRAIPADRTGTINVKVETGQAGEYRYEASVNANARDSFTVRDVIPGPEPQAPPFVQDVVIKLYATAGGWVLNPRGTLTVTAYRLRADGSDGARGFSSFPIANRGFVL